MGWTEYRMVMFVYAVEIFVILCLHKFFRHLIPIVNQFLNTIMEETEGYEKKNTLEILTYRVDRVWFLSKLKHFHVIIHP